MGKKLIPAIILGFVAFATYSCMYAIRKPFAGFIYDQTLLGYNIKNWLVIAQLLGYTLSKFFGIRFIGKLERHKRRQHLILLLCAASLPLWLMTITPIQFWPILMLLNGFPLGIVWGIVFSYLEGRDLTEFMGAMLACTFVFSSGFVKYLAISIQENFLVSPVFASATVSGLACLCAAFFSYLLNKTPPPTEEEIVHNARRLPLSKHEQNSFFKQNKFFLIPAIAIYALLTLMRDFRDNFTAEMLHEDHNLSGQIIAQYETIISVILIAVIPLISLIRNHFAAIQLTFFVALIGSIINLIGLYLFQSNFISGSIFILITGFGLYGGYILINISIMNRIVAYRKNPGNCGFLMYSADASGYLTSIAILCLALFGTKDAIKWFNVYETLIAVGSTAIFFISTYPIIKGLYPTKLTLKSNE